MDRAKEMTQFQFLGLSTYTAELANWPITDAPDDIVVYSERFFSTGFCCARRSRRLPTLLYPIQKMNWTRRQLTV